jgi:hypothetical protein
MPTDGLLPRCRFCSIRRGVTRGWDEGQKENFQNRQRREGTFATLGIVELISRQFRDLHSLLRESILRLFPAEGINTMNGRLWSWAVAALFVFGSLAQSIAAEPSSGKQMYLQYCGSCHGKDGKGNGTVGRELKVKVPDLTVLTKKNKGFFPLDDVMATIDGRRFVRAHGERDMPVWGEAFHGEAEGKKYGELTTLLKAKLIAEYVGTLQRK